MEEFVRKVVSGYAIDNTIYEGIPEALPMVVLKGNGYRKQKIIPDLSVGLGETVMFTHMLMLGSSQSGKTNVISQIASQIASQPNNVCVIFDTKGDYKHHPQIRKPGDIILENGSACPAWNIFEEITVDGTDDGHVGILAREIAEALFRGQKSTNNPFFYQAASDLFVAVLRCFVYKSVIDPIWKEYLHNNWLKEFLLSSGISGYECLFNECENALPDIKGMIEDYLGSDYDAMAKGILSEIRVMVNRFFVGIFNIEPSLEHPSFSIAKEIRSRKQGNIFIEYDIQRGETLAPLYSVLVDLSMKEALSPNRSKMRSNQLFYILDELKLLPMVKHLEDVLNTGRSFRVSVVAGLQNIHQLESVYGKSTSEVILSGFGSLIAMRLNDASSRKYVSERCGRNVVVERIMGPEYMPIEQRREGYVVEDWDMLKLSTGQAIVKLSTQSTPFKFMFIRDSAM